MHRPALDGAGADERNLYHQVVEPTWLQPGQRGHLRAALDLEHAHGVGTAQHRVYVVLLRDGGQIQFVAAVFADEVDRVMERGEHAQPQQVELHQPCGSAVVLVPLQHAAVAHTSPLHRAHLDDWPVADHHAARMDAEVTRRVLDLGGQLQHACRNLVLRLRGGGSHLAPGINLLAPRVLLPGGVAQRLGHVAHRRAGAVGDDVGHLSRVVPPVALVHVLDHLFPATTFDVEVDVGWPIAFGREEPFEQQTQ